MDALSRIVCDDVAPCVGDLTPFLVYPPPPFVPAHYYPNLLTLAPQTGLLWVPNQVSSRGVFAEQPGHAQASYDGHVTGYEARLSATLLQHMVQPSCAGFQEGWALGREVETAGWYPSVLQVSYDAGEQRFTVAMGQLQWKQAYKSKLDALTKVRTVGG
jgi:hypothetical protein